MPSTHTEIELASSPEHVREVFLDFARLPEYTQGFIRAIKPAASKSTIEPGDRLSVTLSGARFSPIVLENTPEQFKWRGSLPYIFTGDHYFRFEPSKKTPGSTTFSQGENFSGLLAFLMGPPFGIGASQTKGFEGFNSDRKRRVESGS